MQTVISAGVLLSSLVVRAHPPPIVIGSGGGPPFIPEIPPFQEIPPLVQGELDRCGMVVDAHLHLATWFTTPEPLQAEMGASGVGEGVIMAVYGPSNPFGTDPNDDIDKIVNHVHVPGEIQSPVPSFSSNFSSSSSPNAATFGSSSVRSGSFGGSITSSPPRRNLFGLASLNTTGNWAQEKDFELNRLATYLEKDRFVGAKIAPPHTRLAMNDPIMGEIVQTIAASSHPVLGIHIGTTPFCGPFGDLILGQRGNCTPEFVDPLFLEPLIQSNPGVTFILMHGGQDFSSGPFDPFIPFYNGQNFDHSVELASKYDNIYIEVSAMLDRNATDGFAYENPLAFQNLKKIVTAGIQNKTIYGSDANAFPGRMLGYLNSTIVSLVDAGFTDVERCNVLTRNTRAAYGIPTPASDTGGVVAPAPSTVTVNVDLYTDRFPEETRWFVRRDGEIVEQWSGTRTSGDLVLIRKTLELEPGVTYEFEILDRNRDGICCGTYGNGRVEINAILGDGEEVALVEFNGRFRTRFTTTFIVPTIQVQPPPPEVVMPPPPSTTECEDSKTDIFNVDTVVGQRGCSWLASNLIRFDYLCRFVDVASACKATCNACEIFA